MGGFGGLHQVLGELFQPGGLAVQNLQVFPGLVVGHRLLFQQVHIADDGGQGGFDVVGDVGDELGLHPLRLHLLLHRVLDALADVVQVFPVLPEGPPQVLCGHFVVQMAGGQLAAPRLEGPHGEDHEEHQSPLQHLQQQPEHHPAAAVIAAHQAQALQEAQQEEAQTGGPEQGQLSQQLPRPPPQSLAPAADRPDQAGKNRFSFPIPPRLRRTRERAMASTTPISAMVSTVGPKATREVPQPLEQATGRNPSSRTAAPPRSAGPWGWPGPSSGGKPPPSPPGAAPPTRAGIPS